MGEAYSVIVPGYGFIEGTEHRFVIVERKLR